MYELVTGLRKRTPTKRAPKEKTGAAKPAPVIQSVDRALDILEALAQAEGKIALAELSARTGLNLSTCHHLVATIVRRGYIAQDRATRHYSLGSKIFELSEARTRQIDLVALTAPHLNRLNRETGEAAHLGVVEGTELIVVARLASLYAVRVDNAISQSSAAHATATGKAILAWLPESEIDEILAAKGMERFTPRTIVTRDALIEELRLVRRYGYAEEREEFRPGVYGVGAALRGHKGVVAGAICLSLPTMRATEEVVAKARRAVKAAALEISKELGAGAAL